MARLGGLQLVKPWFDWGASDKLTELEQFKANCHILFNGPLCDLKEKQRAGLLTIWLGREATQILASVESDVNTSDEQEPAHIVAEDDDVVELHGGDVCI